MVYSRIVRLESSSTLEPTRGSGYKHLEVKVVLLSMSEDRIFDSLKILWK